MKDIAGQILTVGDRVATLLPRYRSLHMGTVVKFTHKGLKVHLDERPGRSLYCTNPMQLFGDQVCKVSQ